MKTRILGKRNGSQEFERLADCTSETVARLAVDGLRGVWPNIQAWTLKRGRIDKCVVSYAEKEAA